MMQYPTFDHLPREASGFMLVCDWQRDFDNCYKECVAKFGKEIVEAYLKIKGISKPQPKVKEAFKVFSLDDQTKRFQEQQPIYYDRAGLWWLWNSVEFKWEMVDEIDVLNMIKDALGVDIITSKSRTEILNSLKQSGRKNEPKPIKPTWIQFKDMIYDIGGDAPFKASPEWFTTNRIPHTLNKDILTPTFDRLFSDWVGVEHVKTLYEILSYCLIPDYPIHRLFCLIGGGSNGKSCFLRVVENLVGNENVCATELETLINSRFEITKLYRKLVCVMGETNFSEISKTSIIKKLTGQDLIGFEYKNKTPFEAKNYAKILIATNNLPATTDKTEGFYRRWTIIDFPNKFTEEKDILKEIPTEEYESLCSKCFMILLDLIKGRKFSGEGSIEDRMKRYEDKSNPFDKFWNENIEEDIGSEISSKQFRERFDKWCKDNRFRIISDYTLSQHMKNKNINKVQKRMVWVETGYGQEKPRYWAWEGVKWK